MRKRRYRARLLAKRLRKSTYCMNVRKSARVPERTCIGCTRYVAVRRCVAVTSRIPNSTHLAARQPPFVRVLRNPERAYLSSIASLLIHLYPRVSFAIERKKNMETTDDKLDGTWKEKDRPYLRITYVTEIIVLVVIKTDKRDGVNLCYINVSELRQMGLSVYLRQMCSFEIFIELNYSTCF